MARVLDDAARSKLLSSLLDQNIGQPLTRGQPITDDDVEEEDPPEGVPQQQMPVAPGGAPAPMPGNQMSSKEPMIPVPASLAHAGMQALMSQASGGRSLGADGAMPPKYQQVVENDNAGMPNKLSPEDKEFMQYVTEGVYEPKNYSEMAKQRTKEPTNINGKSMKWNK